ncbi:PqiC family protein [Rhodoferax sp.]|uniref:PqiC family protein n=1 Tax=Rhodoferax sp. TaxID=50421 RepID=UPI00285090CC|nr:PqiC family protein [Rhodoferax sp.]MDR3368533.1 PqiC family protein [Rhodoferax sp.]
MNLPSLSRDPAGILSGAVRSARQGGWLAALLLIGLAGCASQISEPTLYLLRSDPPPGVVAPVEASATAKVSRWQLMLPVRVPEYLDRTALLLPQGANGVQPTFNKRWAEPLSSSVPRVLAQDLNTLRGQGSVWTTPVPDNLVVKGQLRVEVLAFDVAPSGAAVMLKAHWSTAGANGTGAPQSHVATITVPSQTSDADALVSAHRLALWQLAQAIAGTLE